ncbi:MAG: TIGR02266 family protein [Anaeromyxobacter sp.]|nr:TIGR02266 family protein [Anaeromyxobacter sp.]MBL0277786.1 TIGR02266 family protein [Anaeromyxobacter sp.]
MAESPQREPRVATELRVRLSSGQGLALAERSTVDLSRGGVFVRTLEPQTPGTQLQLDLSLPGGYGAIRARGEVIWTTPPSAPGEPPRSPGMGVRFLAMDPASRATLDRFVGQLGGAPVSDEPPRPAGEDIQGEDVFLGFDSELDLDAAPPPPPVAPAVGPLAPVVAVAPSAPTAPALVRPRSQRMVGIDLGTTNSCVAVARNGRAQVLTSRLGHRTIPSVVAFDPHGRFLVGHAAKAQMVVNPRHTVYGSKRLVGRPFHSPTVQACRDRFHYDIVEGAGGVAAVRFAGREFSLQQVAALILTDLRDTASLALGEVVERAVVTVPAYYNDHQRNAVREAGLLAGLVVERIVNEPTAAALAFGYGKGLDERVLVYDLGGGTFDASVLEIQGDVYEVVSTGGDTFLGGVDFDAQLLDHLAWAFMQQHGVALPDDRVVWQRLRDAAEDLKVTLSEQERAVARVPFLFRSADGRDLALEVEVTRAELEELTGRLVERSLETCREVLSARGLGPQDVQEVLLVGGQSRMPLVWQGVHRLFGREPSRGVHPDEAVAIGAALLADSAGRVDSVVLIDALAMGIGVGLPGGRLAPVLPRNTRLPARKTYELATTHDGQTELELQVFQGDSARVTDCEFLGTVRVAGLPPAPRGTHRVAVEFAMGHEGILSITSQNLTTGAVAATELATRDTPEAARAKLGVSGPAEAPRGSRPIEPVHKAGKPGFLARLFGWRR